MIRERIFMCIDPCSCITYCTMFHCIQYHQRLSLVLKWW